MPDQTPGVYVEELPRGRRPIEAAPTDVAGFTGYTERATRDTDGDLAGIATEVVSLAEFERYFGGAAADPPAPAPRFLLWHAVRLFFDNGGASAVVVSCGRFADADAPQRDALLAGVATIGAVDTPALLVVPEAVNLDRSGYSEIVAAMLAQCAARRDRVALVDVFDGANAALDLAAARAAIGGPDLSYGAAYYPFVVTAEAGSTGVTLPPSGAIAGVCASTDRTRGVWKAPANVALAGVAAPAVALDDRAQERFNVDVTTGKSIDVIRAFHGKGIVVWGARTLAGNDNEWRYLSVRRFVTMVETSLFRSLGWVVFEPNAPATWAVVRTTIENFLTDQWRAGALAGAKPEQAFMVRCGLGQTMTQVDVDAGRLVLEVGLAAVRLAEFILLRLSFTTA